MRVSVILAAGAMLTMLAGPVAADECSDYRSAFVLYEAAKRAIVEHPTTFDLDRLLIKEAPGPEYFEAQRRALLALDDAARALRRTIDDEAAAVAVDTIDAARVAINVALQRDRDWAGPIIDANIKSGGTVADLGPHFARAFGKLIEAYGAATAAYHHALHFVCREGVQ